MITSKLEKLKDLISTTHQRYLELKDSLSSPDLTYSHRQNIIDQANRTYQKYQNLSKELQDYTLGQHYSPSTLIGHAKEIYHSIPTSHKVLGALAAGGAALAARKLLRRK